MKGKRKVNLFFICHKIVSFYSLIPYFFESYATVIFLDAESTDIEHYADKIPVLKGLT